jgi:hypothetical protein
MNGEVVEDRVYFGASGPANPHDLEIEAEIIAEEEQTKLRPGKIWNPIPQLETPIIDEPVARRKFPLTSREHIMELR